MDKVGVTMKMIWQRLQLQSKRFVRISEEVANNYIKSYKIHSIKKF